MSSSLPNAAGPIAPRLLAWYARHGRHDLPWKRTPTPYRVWVSEIMLQQTQVATVLGYFEPFMHRFPDVAALAAAQVDEVLHRWSGLGYYARARNLHRAAHEVCERHGGVLPTTLDALTALPGIGASTAGAILALSRGERHPILDANVQRVLCRYHAVEGWPGQTAVCKRLWALARQHTPQREVAAYTQAIMDLGATRCVRRRPVCALCPLENGCRARAERREHELPAPRPKRERPQQRTAFLILRDAGGAFLLERRPPSGVWGGLFGFPECRPERDIRSTCEERFDVEVKGMERLGDLHHGFTHYALDIEPHVMDVVRRDTELRDGDGRIWYRPGTALEVGLAAPVARLIDLLSPAPMKTSDLEYLSREPPDGGATPRARRPR